MAITNRGGHPFSLNLTADTSGAIAHAGVANSTQANGAPADLPAPTSWLRIAVSGSAVRVYFTQRGFDRDVDYLSIAAGAVVEAPLDVRQLWLKGQGGTATVELLAAAKA